MDYINLEFGDNVVIVRDPQGTMRWRLPVTDWAGRLASTLKEAGHGYVPIRKITVAEHAAFTYLINATTEANVEAAARAKEEQR